MQGLVFIERWRNFCTISSSFAKMKSNEKMIYHTDMASSTWSSPWEPCTSPCYSSIGTWKAQPESKFQRITPFISKGLGVIFIFALEYNRWSIDVGWASTWVKIINEWFAATIYRKWFSLKFFLKLAWRMLNGRTRNVIYS